MMVEEAWSALDGFGSIPVLLMPHSVWNFGRRRGLMSWLSVRSISPSRDLFNLSQSSGKGKKVLLHPSLWGAWRRTETA